MKKIILIIYLLLFVSCIMHAQQKKPQGNNIKELMKIEWNTEDGIMTKNYQSGRLGIIGYEIISNNEVAFLCKVDKKIKIFNIETGSITNQFSINHHPKRFIYDSINKKFYVLDRYKIDVYGVEGQQSSSFELNKKFEFIKRLESFNGNVYLLSAEQYTYQLTNNGVVLDAENQLQTITTGWILNENIYGRTYIKDPYTYTIEILENNTVVTNKDFSCNKKIGTVKLIGNSGDLYYIRLSYSLQEVPIKTGARLIIFSKNSETIVQQIDLPNITYSKFRGDIKPFGEKLFQLLTTPNNAVLFELCNESFTENVLYPEKYNYEYHYNLINDDSIQIENNGFYDNTKDSIKQTGKDDPTNLHY